VDIDRQDKENLNVINEIRNALGNELLILGHYYQRLRVSLLSDHLGDSYGLSALAAASDSARYIVFCGVAFMAESADILRSPHQSVFHPCRGAGCPMADMADIEEVERAFDLAGKAIGKKVIPVAYMNTTSEVKAFCGRMGGLVCTSSNAHKAFKWAFERGDAILFLPDEHLGMNTADLLKIPMQQRVLYDPSREHDENMARMTASTRLILWKGYCHVHTYFTTEQIAEARKEEPGAAVVVHPECPREVVSMSDYSGSTAFMHRFIEDAPEGSTTVVGTEINMVEYLNHRYGGSKTVLPLARSLCPNMYKINLGNLRETLENLSTDSFRVDVDPATKKHARTALSRMLEIR